MIRAWKIVFCVFGILVAAGLVLAAAGYFTGASVSRMIEVAFGSREALDTIIQLLKQELAAVQF